MRTDTPAPSRFPLPAPPVELPAFLARHGTRYDAAADSYTRDPFVVDQRHGKASALYNAHAYHTKVPPAAIRPYIEHYTNPGDIVLDPFCGSGMTGVAALLSGRNAILSDISPAAVHIAYNYCTPVNATALQRAWEAIRQDVADEFAWLYGTRCDNCGGPATIQYTVWSDVLGCPRCEAEIVLWDVAVVRAETKAGFDPPLSGLTPGCEPVTVAQAPAKKDGKAREAGDMLDGFSCPVCKNELTKARCRYLRGTPVLTSYECQGLCRPKRKERAPSDEERARIADVAAQQIPYPVPDVAFDERREMFQRNARIFRDRDIARVRDFWTPRNLWALASLWSRVSAVADERMARALRFVVSGAMWLAAKLYRYRSGGGGGEQGKLAIPSLTRENNVSLLVSAKLNDVRAAIGFMPAPSSSVVTLVQSATNLAMPSETLDYIFTDPPFGSNLFYADLSLLWEAWLGELTDESQEAVWNRSRRVSEDGKSLDDYRELMERSFAEMHRVLKPGRWATVVFSNSDDRVWHAIQVAAQKAGFAVAGAGTLDKMQRSFKGVRGDKGDEKVVTKDVVMNLLKPVDGRATSVSGLVGDPEALIRARLDGYLAGLAADEGTDRDRRTTQALYDHIVTSLLGEGIPTAGFSLALVQSVAQDAFKQIDGRWYRRGERVRSGRLGLDIADDASAITWLDARLGLQAMTEAEIIPEFNTASAGARIAGGLGRLLAENFRMDPQTKRWRVPTLLERDTLNDIGRLERRKRVERAADGAFHDLTASELLELAEDATQLDMYGAARAILGRISSSDLSGAETQRATLVRMVADFSLEPDE